MRRGALRPAQTPAACCLLPAPRFGSPHRPARPHSLHRGGCSPADPGPPGCTRWFLAAASLCLTTGRRRPTAPLGPPAANRAQGGRPPAGGCGGAGRYRDGAGRYRDAAVGGGRAGPCGCAGRVLPGGSTAPAEAAAGRCRSRRAARRAPFPSAAWPSRCCGGSASCWTGRRPARAGGTWRSERGAAAGSA